MQRGAGVTVLSGQFAVIRKGELAKRSPLPISLKIANATSGSMQYPVEHRQFGVAFLLLHAVGSLASVKLRHSISLLIARLMENLLSKSIRQEVLHYQL